MGAFRFLSCVAGLMVLAACGDRAADEPPAPEETTRPTVQTEEALPPREAGPTLVSIRSRGRLNCGVHPGLVGFSYTDNQGRWRGFDVDFCRATAAAVLGNPDAVRYVPLDNAQRLEALREGRVDVLWRNTSWTLGRDGAGFNFPGINYFDGQGFLVRRNLDVASATELNGARICVQGGSTSELNLADFFAEQGLDYTPVVHASEADTRAAYQAEECDALSADVSALAAARTTFSDSRAHVILPEVISREPLGPVVREGDDQWSDIVGWTLHVLILAESLGVTEGGLEEALGSRDPQVRRLLGADQGLGAPLGLDDDWARNAIAAGGNYGEIFERHLGERSALDLSRGLNALWTDDPRGLMYAPAIR